ncbi:transcription factor ATOH8 [Paroedura picta]|uniref:transcription factor ATOH8 n=1 Tax=Paroedura picta TaxID=143630 RepID=UPI004055ED6F
MKSPPARGEGGASGGVWRRLCVAGVRGAGKGRPLGWGGRRRGCPAGPRRAGAEVALELALEPARPPGAPEGRPCPPRAPPPGPDMCPAPRKRLPEASGGAAGAAEVRALQQTRRLLANARERTRVHTISAAFEALRKQVPCYSYGQKLSKLAILRIACNYILSLARLADLDYSSDHSNLSFSECVEQCTRTLQAEGRSKKRKE